MGLFNKFDPKKKQKNPGSYGVGLNSTNSPTYGMKQMNKVFGKYIPEPEKMQQKEFSVCAACPSKLPNDNSKYCKPCQGAQLSRFPRKNRIQLVTSSVVVRVRGHERVCACGNPFVSTRKNNTRCISCQMNPRRARAYSL